MTTWAAHLTVTEGQGLLRTDRTSSHSRTVRDGEAGR
jgi:hypothetical protein